MIKVLIIFGTRPEAIKLAPVIKTLEGDAAHFQPVACISSQHREMLTQVLEVFDIHPQYDLAVMTPDQSLTQVTARVLEKLAEVIAIEQPDLILVQGDTTTTCAASLAAFYHKVRIAHVEAGLRTGDKYRPFPEEINRRLTAVLADYHFAPTPRNKENLLREGIDAGQIVVTGNTGIDALFMALERLRCRPQNGEAGSDGEESGQRTLLVTAHRRESLGEPIENICKALLAIVSRNPDVRIMYPVHLNPHVRSTAWQRLQHCGQIQLLEPLDYVAFVRAMEKAYLILTDSGGIQEEAPALGKPVLVMRNTTERPEAVEVGAAKLVGTKVDTIVETVQRLLDDPTEYNRMRQVQNPFGDGNASARIARHLRQSMS